MNQKQKDELNQIIGMVQSIQIMATNGIEDADSMKELAGQIEQRLIDNFMKEKK